MESVNVHPRQPTEASRLPREAVVPHARPSPWPEIAGVMAALAMILLFPLVLLGLVLVAVLGAHQ